MTGKLFLPEIMGAGAALFDFDNDGDLDVFVVQGSTLEAGRPAGPHSISLARAGDLRSRLFRKRSGCRQRRESLFAFHGRDREEWNCLLTATAWVQPSVTSTMMAGPTFM